ncbi:hypothetical protein ACQKIY_13875 [Bacillus mycoides]|nr:hypothetical protein [Bacillus mycoides]
MENRTTLVTKENEWFNYKLMVHGDNGIGKSVKEFVQVDPHK